MNLEIAEVSQGMNVEISQARQGIKLELAFGLTQTKADTRYASQAQVTQLTNRIATAENGLNTLDGAVAKQAFKTFRVGNTTVSATLKNDEITLAAAGGIEITINAQTKKITFDTSALKQGILDITDAAALSSFVKIFSKDSQTQFSATDKEDTLSFETIHNTNMNLLYFTTSKNGKTVQIDIKKLESVINSISSTLNGVPNAIANAVDQAISAEVSNRNSAIETETNARIEAVNNEASARQSADSALSASITAEAGRAASAEQANATTIQNEAQARANADLTLLQDISSETSARQNADNALSYAITEETQARKKEDDRLSSQIKDIADTVGTYGVEWDWSQSSPDVTRIGNMEYHRTLPIQNRMYRHIVDDDGNEVYKLDPNDSTKKADGTPADLTGADGQVMVHIPEMWVRTTSARETKLRFEASLLPFSGGIHFPGGEYGAEEASLDRTTNKLCSVCNDTPRYRGGNNTATWDGSYRSLLGMPATSISLTKFREYARNRGSVNWNSETFWMRNIVYWLFVLEYATLNSQKAIDHSLTTEGYRKGGLGTGVTNINTNKWSCFNGYNPFVRCGTTNSLGNNTGEIQYTMPFEYDACVSVSGTYTMMYRGVFDSTVTYGTDDHVSVGEDLYKSKSDNNTGHDVTDTIYWTKITRTVTYVNSYRGIVLPFGHIWKWLDGVLVEVSADSEDEPVSKVYTCNDPARYSSTISSYYTHIGNQARGNGYVKELLISSVPTIIAKTFGGSANTYVCDYVYNSNLPSSGLSVRGVFCGGTAKGEAYCGFAYCDSSYAPSVTSANIGSRLCFARKFPA